MFNLSFGELILLIPAILIGITFHEFAHARVAIALGDNTPDITGRNTLNPIKHIDPVGFILLLIAGFGWAKPVMVNPANFKNRRRDEILVALAGPAANLAIVLFSMVLLKILVSFDTGSWGGQVVNVIFYLIFINLSLMLFNLLPLPPLDGSRILFNLLPNVSEEKRRNFFRYGSWVFLAVILLERVSGFDILPIGRWVRFLVVLLLELFGITTG